MRRDVGGNYRLKDYGMRKKMKLLAAFLDEHDLEMLPSIKMDGNKSIVTMRFHDVCGGDVAEIDYYYPGVRAYFKYPRTY